MMDWTDRHDRYFLRLISRHALLYSEMITTAAILHGDRDRLLAFDPSEHPLALQLGGAEPGELGRCARIAETRGYDEVNLNLGCPSDRVQQGRFGACLMAEPDLVARCIDAMTKATGLPVTVKTRIGIDEHDTYEDLVRFVRKVAGAGCGTFIIHARKAWLKGLSAKENREVPPLDYHRVYALKRDFPELEIILNGGVETLAQAAAHRTKVDGVMIGRAAYGNPYMLADADLTFFDDAHPIPSREEIALALIPYAQTQCAKGVPVKSITRHILGLFNGLPGARLWRRYLSEVPHASGVGPEVIAQALEQVHAVRQAREAA